MPTRRAPSGNYVVYRTLAAKLAEAAFYQYILHGVEEKLMLLMLMQMKIMKKVKFWKQMLNYKSGERQKMR